MQTFGEKIRQSGKGLSDQSWQFISHTREAGMELVTYVQGEARDWGEYLREQAKHLGDQGRGRLPAVDSILTRVAGEPAMEQAEAAEGADETAKGEGDETSEFEEVSEEEETQG